MSADEQGLDDIVGSIEHRIQHPRLNELGMVGHNPFRSYPSPDHAEANYLANLELWRACWRISGVVATYEMRREKRHTVTSLLEDIAAGKRITERRLNEALYGTQRAP